MLTMGKRNSTGSKVPFKPHTENVYNQRSVHFFALITLRGDPKVSTSLIFFRDILMHARFHLPLRWTYEEFISEISQPNFRMKTGPSFEHGGGLDLIAPIMSESTQGQLIVRLNLTLILRNL